MRTAAGPVLLAILALAGCKEAARAGRAIDHAADRAGSSADRAFHRGEDWVGAESRRSSNRDHRQPKVVDELGQDLGEALVRCLAGLLIDAIVPTAQDPQARQPLSRHRSRQTPFGPRVFATIDNTRLSSGERAWWARPGTRLRWSTLSAVVHPRIDFPLEVVQAGQDEAFYDGFLASWLVAVGDPLHREAPLLSADEAAERAYWRGYESAPALATDLYQSFCDTLGAERAASKRR